MYVMTYAEPEWPLVMPIGCDVLELTEQKSRNGLGEPCYASVSPPSSAHRISDGGVEVALRRGSQGPLRTFFFFFFGIHNTNEVETLCAINQERRPNAAMRGRPCGGVPS